MIVFLYYLLQSWKFLGFCCVDKFYFLICRIWKIIQSSEKVIARYLEDIRHSINGSNIYFWFYLSNKENWLGWFSCKQVQIRYIDLLWPERSSISYDQFWGGKISRDILSTKNNSHCTLKGHWHVTECMEYYSLIFYPLSSKCRIGCNALIHEYAFKYPPHYLS